jgi:hypothetical protein
MVYSGIVGADARPNCRERAAHGTRKRSETRCRAGSTPTAGWRPFQARPRGGVVRASIGGAAFQLQLRHGDLYAFNLDSNVRQLVTHFLPPVRSRFDLRTVAPLSFDRCHAIISRVVVPVLRAR